MKLKKIISKLNEADIIGGADCEINSLAYDSRRVEPGGLFFAVSGLKYDGHDYIDKAIEAGAVAVVVEKPGLVRRDNVAQVIVSDSRRALAAAADAYYNYPSSKLKLIGITGTNGKTTTAFLIEQIFAAAGFKTGLISTILYKLGNRTIPAQRTTPESLDLQAFLAEMIKAEVKVAVMEVSSHAVHLKRVEATRFNTLVFTNLTQDHLDYHQDMDSYFQAKAALFIEPQFETAARIVNIDDLYGRRLRKLLRNKCLTYGFNANADVVGSNLESTRHGLSLTISGLGRELDISTGLKGMFNGANILAAVSAAWQFNIDNVVIKQAFRTIKNVPGRFQSVDRGQKFQVVIDYAHTPDGLRQLLKSARAVTTGKLIIVFGCGGDRDRDKRPLMGAIAAELSDEMIITSDNPRSEAPEEIIDDIVSGLISDQCQYNIVIDRRQAIYEAINRAKKGDMVVIAGKGHETGQIFADKVVSFNDVEEVEKILSEIISDKSKSA